MHRHWAREAPSAARRTAGPCAYSLLWYRLDNILWGELPLKDEADKIMQMFTHGR